MAFMVICFFISWTPFLLVSLYGMLGNESYNNYEGGASLFAKSTIVWSPIFLSNIYDLFILIKTTTDLCQNTLF